MTEKHPRVLKSSRADSETTWIEPEKPWVPRDLSGSVFVVLMLTVSGRTVGVVKRKGIGAKLRATSKLMFFWKLLRDGLGEKQSEEDRPEIEVQRKVVFT